MTVEWSLGLAILLGLAALSKLRINALGSVDYVQQYTGNSPATYQVYTTTKYTSDYNGNLTQILESDGTSKLTFQYDAAGRQTGSSSPDLGLIVDQLDADGNIVQKTDVRGHL